MLADHDQLRSLRLLGQWCAQRVRGCLRCVRCSARRAHRAGSARRYAMAEARPFQLQPVQQNHVFVAQTVDIFSMLACHPCAGAMLIFSVSFQF